MIVIRNVLPVRVPVNEHRLERRERVRAGGVEEAERNVQLGGEQQEPHTKKKAGSGATSPHGSKVCHAPFHWPASRRQLATATET